MPIYEVYKVINGGKVLSIIPSQSNEIIHPKFKKFSIINEMSHIKITGLDQIPSVFYPPEFPKIEDVNIDALIARHSFIYLLICLSGTGLRSLRGSKKYVKKEIVSPIASYIKDTYKIPINFAQFEYQKENFLEKYWGDDVTTKLGFDDENKSYVKVSCSDYNLLVKKYPGIGQFFDNQANEIVSIKGKNASLEFETPERKYPGKFKFSQDGIFSCDFADIHHFNKFVIKLIDNGFYKEADIHEN
jgi:hypothetical protein